MASPSCLQSKAKEMWMVGAATLPPDSSLNHTTASHVALVMAETSTWNLLSADRLQLP